MDGEKEREERGCEERGEEREGGRERRGIKRPVCCMCLLNHWQQKNRGRKKERLRGRQREDERERREVVPGEGQQWNLCGRRSPEMSAPPRDSIYIYKYH